MPIETPPPDKQILTSCFKWMDYVRCSSCGKRVSNFVCGHDDDGLVVRAWVECPECVVNSNREPKDKD